MIFLLFPIFVVILEQCFYYCARCSWCSVMAGTQPDFEYKISRILERKIETFSCSLQFAFIRFPVFGINFEVFISTLAHRNYSFGQNFHFQLKHFPKWKESSEEIRIILHWINSDRISYDPILPHLRTLQAFFPGILITYFNWRVAEVQFLDNKSKIDKNMLINFIKIHGILDTAS